MVRPGAHHLRRNGKSAMQRNPSSLNLRRQLIVALSTIVWLSPGAVRAQEARTMTLSEAIARDRNIVLRLSTNQVALSETGVRKERANFYPNLNLSVTPSQRYGHAFDQATGGYKTQTNESMNVSASSSINLFNGFGDRAAYRSAKLDLNASKDALDYTRQRIFYQTASQFLQVNLNEELIRIEEENLDAQKQLLRQIQAFWEEGRRARADVLQQQAGVAQAELQVLNAKRTLAVSQLQLKQTLGLDPGEEIRFVAPELKTGEEPLPYHPETLIREALQARSDLGAQQQRIASAEEQITSAKAGYWPTLSLSMNTGTNYSSQSNLSGFSSQLFNANPSATVGLSLNLPIFDRAGTRSSVERAQVQLRTCNWTWKTCGKRSLSRSSRPRWTIRRPSNSWR